MENGVVTKIATEGVFGELVDSLGERRLFSKKNVCYKFGNEMSEGDHVCFEPAGIYGANEICLVRAAG